MRETTIAEIMAHDDNGRCAASFHEARDVFVVHCVCHRLALVLTDTIKGTKNVEKVILESCINLLNSLYNYFARSPTKKKAMREYIASENVGFAQRQHTANGHKRNKEGQRLQVLSYATRLKNLSISWMY
jgi:hypothetical protein